MKEEDRQEEREGFFGFHPSLLACSAAFCCFSENFLFSFILFISFYRLVLPSLVFCLFNSLAFTFDLIINDFHSFCLNKSGFFPPVSYVVIFTLLSFLFSSGSLVFTVSPFFFTKMMVGFTPSPHPQHSRVSC